MSVPWFTGKTNLSYSVIWLRAQWILSSETYALILTPWVVLVTGTIVPVLEILPCIYQLIKQYFKSVQTEQAQARVSPWQATPVLNSKKRSLLLSKSISPSERYIYARDMAFFSLDFFSGDRASDLGRIKTIDVLKHPGGSSLLFHQRVGKTLRGLLTFFTRVGEGSFQEHL